MTALYIEYEHGPNPGESRPLGRPLGRTGLVKFRRFTPVPFTPPLFRRGMLLVAPPFIRHPHPSVLPPTFIGRPGSSRCSGRVYYPAVHPLLRHQRLDMLCSSGARERGGYPGDDGELGWRGTLRRAPAMRGEVACVGRGGEVSAWFLRPSLARWFV